MMTKNPLIGKSLASIWLAKDHGAIRFLTESGEEIIAKCDGDCCSHTWIENVDGARDVIGSEVLVAEDIDMPDQPYDEEEFECLTFYGFKVKTASGEMLIDFRNSSNGYYGGNLSWPDDSFYGGVFQQNVSSEEWELISA